MNCPVCYATISTKRKKQIKHLYTHCSEELALTILHLNSRANFYRDVIRQREEQSATLALDDPDDPAPVFALVEEDSEEDSDEAMRAAGMEQCAHCGLWVWPGDMPYHLAVACAEIGEQPGPDDGVHDPGDYQPDPGALSLADLPADYAEVQYIRFAADGPEATLLNALARFIKELEPINLHSNNSYLECVYPDEDSSLYYRIPADSSDATVLNALAWYALRSKGNG